MMRCVGVLLLSVVLLSGCVVPSRSVGHVSLHGTLESEAKQPLANREVDVMVPAEYGLGAVDLRFGGKPEDYFHQDERFSAVTDAKGQFDIDLGDRDYYANLWLLPPLGKFPRRPPAPYFRLQVPSCSGERYAVMTQNGQFHVFDTGQTEIPLSQTHLASLFATSTSGKTAGTRWTVGIVNLRFRGPTE